MNPIKQLRLLAISSVALSGVAFAQDTGVPDEGVDDPATIVVTAQRRAERLQDVPISLAVVSGDAMRDRSVQNFEQFSRLVPNFTVVKSPAANLIMLRGIGSGAGSPSLDQSVVMFIDGIYAGNARQFATPFLDVERIEVLRGPQGALVGRNTSAGAVNVVSRKPGKDFAGYVQGEYNLTFGGPVVEGAVDLPVTSSLSVRLTAKYGDVDGYIYNDLVDQDQPKRREVIGRATAVFDDGGPVVITAKYEHGYLRQRGSPVQVFAPLRGEFRDYEKSARLLTGPETDDLWTDNAVVQFDIDLGPVSLVSISGYSGFKNRSLIDGDFFAGDFATADFDQDLDQFSQEVRLLSPTDGRLNYSIGAIYSTARLDEGRTTGVLFAPAASTFRRFLQHDDVISVFGQLSYKLLDSLRLNGSARWTDQKKSASYRRIGGPLAATLRTGVEQANFRGSTSDSRVDPAASIQFDVNRNTMIYASYGKGSKSAGFQGAISNATAAAFAFRRETSTQYEIGAKLSFPGLGYLNIAAFRNIYRDLQVSSGITVPGSLAPLFFTGNAPEARIEGAEVEYAFRFGQVFSVDGSLAWLPTAKYVDFAAGPCYSLQPSNGPLPGTCTQSGERLGYAPKLSAAANLKATIPVSDSLELGLALSPMYQSGTWRDFVNDPVSRQKAYAKLDARISLATVEDSWEIALIGRNLTDKKTNAYGNSAGLANTFLDPASRVAVIEPPRNFSLQARVKL